jgi:hypothetical protein
MRRAISVILMPLILVSQSMCFGHLHGGTRSLEPVGHSARPHIHLHGTSHHHHDHGATHSHSHDSDHRAKNETTQLSSLKGHDDDSIYLSLSVASEPGRLSTLGNIVKTVSNDDVSGPFIESNVVPDAVSNFLGKTLQDHCARCFLSTRTLSLRI